MGDTNDRTALAAAAAAFLAAAPELLHPIGIAEPAALVSPLVLSSPHSGRIYPASFLDMSRLDPSALRRSEDTYVDDLMSSSVSHGAPLLRALFPRAFLDVNREAYELDPRMFDGRLPPHANTRSMRVAGGLGTIARIVGESQEIYAGRIPVAQALGRIEALYRPYHRALRSLLARSFETFGIAVAVDCHSMPSIMVSGGANERVKADFVMGDRHGTSCDPALVETLERELRGKGYAVHRNKPYAGGYITEHYGRPKSGFHALQIEINRALYMDEATFAQKPAFAAVAADVSDSIAALSQAALSMSRFKAAAE